MFTDREYSLLAGGEAIHIRVLDPRVPEALEAAFSAHLSHEQRTAGFEFIIEGKPPPVRPPAYTRFGALFADDGTCTWAFYRTSAAEIDEAGHVVRFYPGQRWDRVISLIDMIIRELLLARGIGLPLHGSGLACSDGACAFVAPSGGGKTSITRLRQESEVVHDDMLLVRLAGDGPRVYPGLFPCQSGCDAVCHGPHLRRVALLHKAPCPSVSVASPVDAFRALSFSALSVLPLSRMNPRRLRLVISAVQRLLRAVPPDDLCFALDPSFWPCLCAGCKGQVSPGAAPVLAIR